jgi:hypothetical protein
MLKASWVARSAADVKGARRSIGAGQGCICCAKTMSALTLELNAPVRVFLDCFQVVLVFILIVGLDNISVRIIPGRIPL